MPSALLQASCREDDRLDPFAQHPSLQVELDRAGEHAGLDVAADRDEVVRPIAWLTRSISCSMIGPSSRSEVT
jgi:hypothetical protein